ncbi:MAG: Mur ligase family protein [Christensenellales bacterium]
MTEQIHTLIAAVLSIMNGILICFMAYKFLQTYQLNNYHLGRFLNWFKNTNGKYFLRLALVSLISTAGLLVTNILFDAYVNGILGYAGLAFYFVIGILFAHYESKIPKKKPIVFTNRMKRLYFVLWLVTTASTFGIFQLYRILLTGSGILTSLRYVSISVSPILLPFFVLISACIILPFELLNNIRYKNLTRSKLSKRTDLIKIGITGSFAKTSVKVILAAMLKKKYKVLATPASYNTPLGITRSVSALKSSHEVFIAEMGARNVGQIKELCDIVRPTYGIVTGISYQHLETFHTLDNIINTKKELIDSLPEGGLAVVNADSEHIGKLVSDRAEIIYSGLNGEGIFATATELKIDENGSSFLLKIDGESIHCRTNLLGKHNVSNILAAAALSYRLGVSIRDIAETISELKAPPHRLDLKRQKNGMVIIDDTFNANVDGTKAALEILDMFGSRKVIVTPGLVELGNSENSFNRQFGRDIAGVCDVAILIGKNRSKPIREGLIEAGFDENRIYTYNSLYEAKKDFVNVLRADDAVLLENDLPDDYNEVEPVK